MEIDIYRKPTTLDTTIHFTSDHAVEHKLAAYHFLINWINHLPLTSDRKKKGYYTDSKKQWFSSGHNTQSK